jgi:hypothetical protein
MSNVRDIEEERYFRLKEIAKAYKISIVTAAQSYRNIRADWGLSPLVYMNCSDIIFMEYIDSFLKRNIPKYRLLLFLELRSAMFYIHYTPNAKILTENKIQEALLCTTAIGK